MENFGRIIGLLAASVFVGWGMVLLPATVIMGVFALMGMNPLLALGIAIAIVVLFHTKRKA